jgi:hypothetical protein
MIGNYDISYVYGTLKVNKRPITLTSQGADKIYNGTSLKNETVVVGGMGLANRRERLEYSNFAAITNAGSINNTFDYVIYNRYGEDITERNYEVTEDFSALLVVNKRPVTVTVNSYGKGKAYYAAFRNDGDFADDFCCDLIREMSIADSQITLADGVTARKRGNLTFVMNFSDDEKEIILGKEFTDILTGEALSGKVTLPACRYIILK